MYQYRLGTPMTGKQLCRKRPGVFVHTTLTINKQRDLVAKATTSTLDINCMLTHEHTINLPVSTQLLYA